MIEKPTYGDTTVHRLTISTPGQTWASGAPNIFVLKHPKAVALVNTGHATARGALKHGLHELGIAPTDVSTVVATGIWPDLIGNLDVFPNADLCFAASFGQDVSTLASTIARTHATFQGAVEFLDLAPDPKNRVLAEVRAFFDTLINRSPMAIARNPLPLCQGQTIALTPDVQARILEPGGGLFDQLCLWVPEAGWLFSAEHVQTSDEGAWITQPDVYLDTLAEWIELAPSLVLPNRGTLQPMGRAILKRMSLYVNNFMTNVPFARGGGDSAPHLIQRDMGLTPESGTRFLHLFVGYRALLRAMQDSKLLDVGDTHTARLKAES